MLKILKRGKRKEEASGLVGEELAELVRLVGLRAENFFTAHGLSCSEAVLLVLNRGFKGGMSDEVSLALGSGFGGGIGGAGCVCGALSGAVMALGLFLGPDRAGGLSKDDYRRLVGNLHDGFRERSGSVCCRELIADFRKRRKERRLFCNGLTGWVAGETARLILANRPELAEGADLQFLRSRDSRIAALIGRVVGAKTAAGK